MKKTKDYDMTSGHILTKLLAISMPIIGSQIVQMTYNLTDMFWLGRLGSNAVASSGTVGMYLWMSMAFMALGSKGAEIGVSQSMGRKDVKSALGYGQASMAVSLSLGLVYGLVLMFLRTPLVGFFNIQDPEVIRGAEAYQFYLGIGIPFAFVTAAATAIFNGSGNSRVPFTANIISLGINMVLDPLLIFTFKMGIEGAAIATSIAQVAGCVILLAALKRYEQLPFCDTPLFALPKHQQLNQMLKWSWPIAVESFLFTSLTMIISRMVAGWGVNAMAAQRVASQAESLSWLVAGGYSIALTAFVGQNYGGRKWGRIHSCFKISSAVMAVYGIAITVFLFFGGSLVFGIFLPGEAEALRIGTQYLRILAVCQLFACFEAVASGMFKGSGKTFPPALVSVSTNSARVVAAYLLSRTALGLDGIWWAVSIGAGLRGLCMYIWYVLYAAKKPKVDEHTEIQPAKIHP